MNKQEANIKKRKIATTSMAIIGLGLVVGGAFAALSDTLSHDETVTIEWVDIVDGSTANLALEDVNDINNTPVTELTPGITYELTGSLENDSTVVTNWVATDKTNTPGMSVNIADYDGADIPANPNEAIDVAQFGITVTVDKNVSPSTPLNFAIEFSSTDTRATVLSQPTAISDVFIDPALATCVANDDELIAITGGDVNYVISQEELYNVTNLNCEAQGIINLEGLQYMINLETLHLRDNQIEDLTPLSNLTNLTTLNLSYNNISDLSPLANLTGLINLYLAYNEITDVTALSNLTNLFELNLKGNYITDVSALANLTGLDYLNLAQNSLTDISEIANLPNLSKLYVGYNQISDFSSLNYQPVEFYAQYQDIILPDVTQGSATPINIDGINGEDLILTFNTPGEYVNGAIMWENPGVNSLTYASADGSITGTITQTVNPRPTLTQPTAISSVFPDPNLAACVAADSESGAAGDVNYQITQAELDSFTSLDCEARGITNIEGMQYFTNITSLDLANNQITNIDPLENLNSLTYLRLSMNQIEYISVLEDVYTMQYLFLGTNKIEDITPLTNLTNIVEMNLDNNQIKDVTPLANLTNLTYLRLDINQISDFSPLTYQMEYFDGTKQSIVLPETTLGSSTPVTIDGINGEDLIITWTTPGSYVDGELTWDNPGVNSLTYTNTSGTIAGTITQTVN